VVFTSLVWIAFASVCLIIAYLLIWQRGYYMDDYLLRNLVVDPVTSARAPVTSWAFPFFPVRSLSRIVFYVSLLNIPEHEFYVRTFTAVMQAFNALLLGLIINRSLRSKLAAVVGGGFFLFPVFAAEAVLWATVAVYVYSTTFALLFIFYLQSALATSKHLIRVSIFGAVAFAVSLLIQEPNVPVYGVVVMFGAVALTEIQPAERGRTLKRILVYMIPATIVLLLFALAYKYSDFVSSRGGVDFNLPDWLARVETYLYKFAWLTASSHWGLLLLQGSFARGINTLLSSGKGILLLGLAVVLLVLTILSWAPDQPLVRPRYRTGVMLFITGLTWMFVTMLVPGSLGKQQILEYRLLYFPTAGAAVAVSALFWMVSTVLRSHKNWDKVLIGVAGLAVLLSSITMLGYAKLFAQRSNDDRRHIAAVVNTIPSTYLPPYTNIVPYNFDRGLSPGRRFLSGVFESNWSAMAALHAAYHRLDLNAIVTTRWADWRFALDGNDSLRIQIQDFSVPIAKTLIVAYENGRALPIKSLSIVMTDGSTSVVTFPIAENLARDGVPVMETLTVQSAP
jgi:hypothetical protein